MSDPGQADDVRHLSVVITDSAHDRRLLAGIVSAARIDPRIRLNLSLRSAFPVDRAMLGDRVDGVIASIPPAVLPEPVRASVPIVTAWPGVDEHGAYQVHTDYAALAGAALTHLRAAGYGVFGSFDTGDPGWDAAHRIDGAFIDQARERGYRVERFVKGRRTEQRWTLQGQLADLAEWLEKIGAPIGIITCDNDHAWRLATVCRRLDRRVPDDVGIVGCGPDMALASVCDPPVTTVHPDRQREGAELVRVMLAILDGDPVPLGEHLLPPAPITVRASTLRSAEGDPIVARAEHYIRDHLDEKIRIADLEAVTELTGRSLQRRFLKQLGRTPAAHVFHLRMTHAARLLAHTDRPHADIAAATGYDYLSQFSRDFKKQTGMTPTEYRKCVGAE